MTTRFPQLNRATLALLREEAEAAHGFGNTQTAEALTMLLEWHDAAPDLARIAATAAEVRNLQKTYFAKRSTTNLIASIDAEKRLDALLDPSLQSSQPPLFFGAFHDR